MQYLDTGLARQLVSDRQGRLRSEAARERLARPAVGEAVPASPTPCGSPVPEGEHAVALSLRSVLGGPPGGEAHGGDGVALDGEDLGRPVAERDPLAGLGGDVPELVEDRPGDRRVLALGDLDADVLEVVDREPAGKDEGSAGSRRTVRMSRSDSS